MLREPTGVFSLLGSAEPPLLRRFSRKLFRSRVKLPATRPELPSLCLDQENNLFMSFSGNL